MALLAADSGDGLQPRYALCGDGWKNRHRNAPYLGFYGVRPAFYLDTQYYQVTGGDGTADSPYRGAAVNKPEENFTVSGDRTNTGAGVGCFA